MVGPLGLEHVVNDDEQGVRDGDQGFVDAAATGEAPELGPDIGGLAARIGPGAPAAARPPAGARPPWTALTKNAINRPIDRAKSGAPLRPPGSPWESASLRL